MVTAFAPVNIAWVKYMGKRVGGPANASFSITLDSLGSRTRIDRIRDSSQFEFVYEESPYVPPASGQEKIRLFLSDLDPFSSVLGRAGIPCDSRPGVYRIRTRNNVPAGTGIASSASGFAALTLAWAATLAGEHSGEWMRRYRQDSSLPGELADISRRGSGSACRSFHGPFVEWDVENRIVTHSGFAPKFVDFILLFETEEKKVSSSEAHRRVLSSPHFSERERNASERIEKIKNALHRSDISTLAREVRNEAIQMHELFHTSIPPFGYLNENSRFWLSGDALRSTPFSEAILTADAGANVHVFVPDRSAEEFRAFLGSRFPQLRFLTDRSGRGADYDSEGF
jgi:diphosphomevalonate decarboxylase